MSGITVKRRRKSRHPELLERFKEFHRDNPHVFVEMLGITREIRSAGVERIGPEFVTHRLRWLSEIEGVETNSDYAFDENYSSLYVRLIMLFAPELNGMFRTKRTKAWSGRMTDLVPCLEYCGGHQPSPV